MNISCPPSFYDLTFEPSKTYVEFKDWKPMFTFIEKAIQHLWRKNIGCGQAETLKEDDKSSYVAEDFFDGSLMDLEFATRKRTKKYQLSSSLDKLAIDNLFLMEHEDMPFEKNNGNKPFKNQQSETKFSHWTDYSFQSWSDSLSKEAFIVNQRSDWHLWSSDNNFVSEDYFLENGFVASGRPNCLMYNNISSKLCNEFLKVESYVTDETARSGFPFDNREHCNGSQFRKNISKPLLQRCSSQRNWPLDKEMIEIDYGVESPIGSFKKKKQGCSNASFSMLEVSGETYHPFSKALWQDGESCSQIYPKRTGGIPRDFDFLISSAKLFLSCGGDVSVEANDLQFGSVTLAENSASHHQSLNMGTSNLLMQFSYKNEVEESFRSEKKN
ncbi:DNA mismatch repair protein MLH3-like [Hibiscus syriacus]|uniref:DNA mismatch repair protein MLH3-like n=1 Tax=Hibiscus syriacus TaxID=106335 RepID=UPI0019210A93|nr:DNA mismatch repair protein MLH3-like [Hibiscus syriacus]